jgi:hypothetical protein
MCQSLLHEDRRLEGTIIGPAGVRPRPAKKRIKLSRSKTCCICIGHHSGNQAPYIEEVGHLNNPDNNKATQINCFVCHLLGHNVRPSGDTVLVVSEYTLIRIAIPTVDPIRPKKKINAPMDVDYWNRECPFTHRCSLHCHLLNNTSLSNRSRLISSRISRLYHQIETIQIARFITILLQIAFSRRFGLTVSPVVATLTLKQPPHQIILVLEQLTFHGIVIMR